MFNVQNLRLTLAATAMLALAACSGQPKVDAQAPTDTGNMAYPTPSPGRQPEDHDHPLTGTGQQVGTEPPPAARSDNPNFDE